MMKPPSRRDVSAAGNDAIAVGDGPYAVGDADGEAIPFLRSHLLRCDGEIHRGDLRAAIRFARRHQMSADGSASKSFAGKTWRTRLLIDFI